MINIKHIKVVSKPPTVKKCFGDKKAGRDCSDIMKEENMTDNRRHPRKKNDDSEKNSGNLEKTNSEYLLHPADDCNNNDEIETAIKNIGYDSKKLKTNSDFNQNFIEPNSCSFDQLCSMINDLEQDIAAHGIDGLRKNEHDHFNANGIDREEIHRYPDVSHEYSNSQLQAEKDYCNKQCVSSPSTYEDIMSLLGALDHEGMNSGENNSNGFLIISTRTMNKLIPCSKARICDHGYLTQVSNNQVNVCSKNAAEMQNNRCIQCCNSQGNYSVRNSIPETLKEDLATVQLQLEEREETLKFLKNELKAQRLSACEKLESQTKQHSVELHTQKTKYQTIIKRHQKFIEQIITDKKNLTEKCNSLTEHIKEMEIKYQRELKVLADRHNVELQRARELCAASEKIRRERWLEAKTSKIKEMTVKGLEPELRSMVEQHQLELQEIRSAHIKELQDMELRTIRRSNQQLEQLRLELTASHEKLMSNEKEILRARYQEKLEQQESLFQEQRRKLLDDLERERNILAEDQKRLNAEKDAAINQARSQFNEKINTLMRQNQLEKKSLQESLRVEQETWMENCRRQHNMKLEKMESRLRDECNRERDRQIELAIERLEKETLDMKTSLQQSSENRLRCMKEKYEAELQDLNNTEQLLKSKVTSMQERLTEATNQLQKTEEKLQQLTIQLSNSNQIVDQLTIEKNNAKKVVRQEIETEKRELEDKIASLYRELTDSNSNRDIQMAQLYSRVKLIVTQKDLVIGKLSKENDEVKKKCDHLEKLLDQQRKDYVLKSL